MVDIRQLNPQQLTEVSQRIDQELQVLQGFYSRNTVYYPVINQITYTAENSF